MFTIQKITSIPSIVPQNMIWLLSSSSGIKLLASSVDGQSILGIDDEPMLNGPASLFYTEQGIYAIQSYSDLASYRVSSSDGVVSVADGFLYFTCTDTNKATASFTFNEKVYTITMKALTVTKPSIVSPVNGSTNIAVAGTTLNASSFSMSYALSEATHKSSDWEVSTDPTFAVVTYSSYNDTNNLLTYTVPT